MEVHPHTHTARKKWTNYFWEFLMLFLAVTAGFFMENQREHYIEHKRAKAFARSLLEDLKKDTLALSESRAFSIAKAESMGKLMMLMHQPISTWNDSVFYSHAHYLNRVAPFVSTQGTYEQVKNSGSLRYFPQELVGLLNSYDVYSKRAEDRDALDTKTILEIFIPFSSKLINFEVANEIIYDLPATHERFIKIKTKDVTDEFINYLQIAKRSRERSMNEYNKMSELAHELFKELKDEYHLE